MLNKSFVMYSLLVLMFSGCDYRFEAKPDKSDYIIYQTSNGELGASWIRIVFHGDGSIGYYGENPYEGIGPEKVISGTYQLSIGRTEKLFQSLIDTGLFSLKDKTVQGTNLPFTSISANIDGHTIDVSWNIIADSDSDKKYSRVNILITEIIREIDILFP
ncbi:MAG: hypothetical protein JSV13_02905 [Nitrospiraceae bacterium]|nr:MAG: hypothetical protein JSV13_02905 [Nitrospiraceae bacterium]